MHRAVGDDRHSRGLAQQHAARLADHAAVADDEHRPLGGAADLLDRRRDPLAPHGMALFYCEPGGQLYDQLRTATRIFLADDEAASLPHLLYGLAQHAREGYNNDQRFDPRTSMCNKTDSMSNQAVFAGIGVVTLDTPHGDWPTAHVHLHIAPLLRAPGVPRYVAAAEVGGGIYFNPVHPEDAAAALRDT